MANKKITELTALTDPDANDLLAIVDDPSGSPETKRVTIDNLLKDLHTEGSSNFAGPGGVTITHNLNLTNYAPHIIPTADSGGAIGEVRVTDIAVNSFVVRNSGIAVTTFTWVIHNRT
jgi:hypothetical protein